MTVEFAGTATRLQPADIEAEAAELLISVPAIRAVCDVESAGAGFLPDGRPKILYEAHVFYRITSGRFGVSNVSAPAWDRSLYGAFGAHQYDRLAVAVKLDRAAALQSASWGMFQILGSNYRIAGYRDIEAFVAGMMTGERAHLDAFGKFCDAAGLLRYLRLNPPDFASFARGYNGKAYAANAYDTKLESAWRKYRDAEAPAKHYATLRRGSLGPDVMLWQGSLIAAGFAVSVDGSFGPATEAKTRAFQKFAGLVSDGVVGNLTRAAMDKRLGMVA